MKVFLDTNILLDLLLERDGYEESAQIFQLQEEGKLSLCVSFLTMVNIAYVYKKTVGNSLAVANLKYLSSLVDVLPMENDMLQQSIYLDGRDFEDILQYVCAATADCDYIITRNVKDYTIKKGLGKEINAPKVLTPSDFLVLFLNPEF